MKNQTLTHPERPNCKYVIRAGEFYCFYKQDCLTRGLATKSLSKILKRQGWITTGE